MLLEAGLYRSALLDLDNDMGHGHGQGLFCTWDWLFGHVDLGICSAKSREKERHPPPFCLFPSFIFFFVVVSVVVRCRGCCCRRVG